MPQELLPSFEEYLVFLEISQKWARTYDTKVSHSLHALIRILSIANHCKSAQDWEGLRTILAPRLKADYSSVTGKKWDAMTPAEFVDMISSEHLLGDKLIRTQHHLGVSSWRKINDNFATAWYQMRATHERLDESGTLVGKFVGHGMCQHFYEKIDGEWKFGGLTALDDWMDNDPRTVFKDFPIKK